MSAATQKTGNIANVSTPPPSATSRAGSTPELCDISAVSARIPHLKPEVIAGFTLVGVASCILLILSAYALTMCIRRRRSRRRSAVVSLLPEETVSITPLTISKPPQYSLSPFPKDPPLYRFKAKAAIKQSSASHLTRAESSGELCANIGSWFSNECSFTFSEHLHTQRSKLEHAK
ncbi:hypothetical protein AMATHDRAFT_7110 [Amanita thiersii Skay4041]|uniref:Uncharacterized protein n=1 Tax=Amanita thiersii Skay4041 TaxID=703135 RepID=A0A2A9NHC9_9AGAR|nr:hypothetical protein AMATHDRAFT_7110 [Amanita thiersii Skay4041]